jgi:hypothetical protein
MATEKLCAVGGCGKPTICKGLCNSHYLRKRRYGAPSYVATRKTRRFIEQALAYEGDNCLFWPYSKKYKPYIRDEEGKLIPLTRFVCRKAHGNEPTPKHEAAHSCGNGQKLACCNTKHLRWATRVENQADRLEHGTHNRGEKCGSAKLSERDVRNIRGLLAAGLGCYEIAEDYSMSAGAIYHILRGTTWAWLDQGS